MISSRLRLPAEAGHQMLFLKLCNIPGDFGEWDLLLRAFCHVFHHGFAGSQLIAADDDGEVSLCLACLLHLAFEASALKVHICDDAVLTQRELDLHAFGLCFFAESGDVDVFICFRFGDQMLHFQSEQETFKTDCKADARCGRTADLFDEAVIAAAAADCALRSERWILNLESGIRIVVEPAHELRVDGVGDPKSCEVGFQSFELLVATLTEIVRDDRRTDSCRFAALFLAVEKTKRILVESGLAVFTELALLGFEEFDELLSVLRTAVRIADGVQMEIEIFQSELMEISQAIAMTSASASGEDAPRTSRPNWWNSR